MAKLMIKGGKIVDIFNMNVEDVSKEVIILGACRINRFLGQTEKAYPVACHLIGGWRYLDDIGADLNLKKQWLIHEAFESYSGVDLPSPLKAQLPLYKEAEKKALDVIAFALNVNAFESTIIKELDSSLMVTEALALMGNDEYWINFANDNSIVPLKSMYVIHDLLSEHEIKTELEKIWALTFIESRAVNNPCNECDDVIASVTL